MATAPPPNTAATATSAPPDQITGFLVKVYDQSLWRHKTMRESHKLATWQAVIDFLATRRSAIGEVYEIEPFRGLLGDGMDVI